MVIVNGIVGYKVWFTEIAFTNGRDEDESIRQSYETNKRKVGFNFVTVLQIPLYLQNM